MVGELVVGEAGGSAVIASVGGSEVVASVGGCAVECGAVARRYRKFHFILKTSISGIFEQIHNYSKIILTC